MIYGLAKSQLDEVLSKMRESEFEFHLTGSRYFNTHNQGSDYDFFAQDGKDVRGFLRDLGFEVPGVDFMGEEQEYHDDNIAIVFRHLAAGVDVQLQRNLEKKFRAQILLLSLGVFYNRMSKVSQRNYWNRAYNALNNLGL